MAVQVAAAALLVWTVRLIIGHATQRRRIGAPPPDWLVIVAAGTVVVPLTVGRATGAIRNYTNAAGYDEYSQATWISIVVALFSLGCSVFCVAILVRHLQSGIRLSIPPVLLLVVVAVSTLQDAASGESLFQPRQVVLVLLLLAACISNRTETQQVIDAGVYVALIIVGLGFLTAMTQPESAFRTCRVDKCSVFGDLYLGAYGNENATALGLSLASGFVLAGTVGWIRIFALVLVALSIVATGSRTALIAMLAVLLLAFVVTSVRGKMGRRVGWGVILGIAVLSVALPYQVDSQRQFTGRAGLWQVAKEMIRDRPLFGSGHAAWAKQAQFEGGIGDASAYSAHNQALDVAVNSGFVGLGVFLIAAGLVFMYVANRGVVPYLFIGTVVVSMTERPISLETIDWLTWSFMATLLLAASRRDSPSPHQLPREIGESRENVQHHVCSAHSRHQGRLARLNVIEHRPPRCGC